MSLALTLFRLQQIDSQVDKYQSRLNIITNNLKDDSSFRQVKENAELLENLLASAEKQQLQLDNEIKVLRIKIEQSDSSLYSGSVKSPRDLQDIQNELLSLRRYLQNLEDQLLEAMIAVEETQNKNNITQEQLRVEKVRWGNINQNLIHEQSQLHQELQKLDMERTAITKSISTEQLSLYEQLRNKRKGLAVTTIQENACAACGTTLTLSTIQTAHSPGDVTHCPSCGRILYGN